jgi:hypothetical protein
MTVEAVYLIGDEPVPFEIVGSIQITADERITIYAPRPRLVPAVVRVRSPVLINREARRAPRRREHRARARARAPDGDRPPPPELGRALSSEACA